MEGRPLRYEPGSGNPKAELARAWQERDRLDLADERAEDAAFWRVTGCGLLLGFWLVVAGLVAWGVRA